MYSIPYVLIACRLQYWLITLFESDDVDAIIWIALGTLGTVLLIRNNECVFPITVGHF